MGRYMVKMAWKKFSDCIEGIKKWSDTVDELYGKYNINLIESPTNFLIDDLVDMLELNLDDKYETISWWCWEVDFWQKK